MRCSSLTRCGAALMLVPAQAFGEPPAESNATPEIGPVVELIDAGAAPHQTLRYDLVAGSTETMLMTMRMQMTQTLDGMKLPSVAVPPMVMTMRLNVIEKTDDGDYRYDFELLDADVADEPGAMPQMVAMLRQNLRTMIGAKGTGLLSERGVSKETEFDMPPGMDPTARQSIESLEQSLSQVGVVLPEEPIGVGGSWKVIQKLDLNGIHITNTSTITLRARDGSRIELQTDTTGVGDTQEIDNPGMPGTTITVNSVKAKGEGSARFDLHRLVPFLSTVAGSSDVDMMIDTGLQAQDVVVTTNIELRIEPKEEGKEP